MRFRHIFQALCFGRSRSHASDEKREVLLSKSKYLVGLQCPKALWIHYNDKKLVPPFDAGTSFIFEQGHEVGTWAKKLFSDAIDLTDVEGFEEPVRATRIAVRQEKPIFEAAFIYDSCFSRADILVPVGDGQWDIIEVKSSTAKPEVPDVYLQDLAFQRFVYEGAGLRIRECCLLRVDNTYIRDGAIDPGRLLVKTDVTQAVDVLLPAVKTKVAEMRTVLRLRECPEVKVSPHCSKPYDCALMDVCWSFLPQPSIFNLRYGNKKSWELFGRDILRMEDIPQDFVLDESQLRQIACHKSGNTHVDPPAIRCFLKSFEYPLYFLDFETIQAAVPLFDHSRPYSQIPFQFSLHLIPARGAAPRHFSFLAAGRSDPRPALMAELTKLLGSQGSIVGYNTSFEITRLAECAAFFPEHAQWCTELRGRFVDLLDVFRNLSYYHPSQNGSASLKAVLPALTSTSYDGLEIGEGDTASREFMRVTFSDVEEEDRSRVRAALAVYCKQDTKALVEILHALEHLSS
jgi:hypothetical protein